MAVPLLAPAAAAPAAAAKVGGGAILSTLLTGLLSGAAEGAIQSATAPGALTPSPAQGWIGVEVHDHPTRRQRDPALR